MENFIFCAGSSASDETLYKSLQSYAQSINFYIFLLFGNPFLFQTVCYGDYVNNPSCVKVFGNWLSCRTFVPCKNKVRDINCITQCDTEKIQKRFGFGGVKKMVSYVAGKNNSKVTKKRIFKFNVFNNFWFLK